MMRADRAPSRATWLRGRTRNAARRGLLVATVGSLVMTAALILFVLIPRRVDQVLNTALRAVPPDRDTVVWQRTMAEAERRERRASSMRDSMAQEAALRDSLGGLIARARAAPLIESYRALAAAPALEGDARTQSLRAAIERVHAAREASAALSGPDARYATLTRDLTTLGQQLVLRADSLRPGILEAAALLAVPPAVDSVLRAEAQRAGRAAAEADSMLRVVRQTNDSLHEVRESLRRSHALVLPPWAMLGAAAIMGLAFGFVVAIWREMRRPTVADAAELAALTGVRVLEADSNRAEAWPLLHLTLSNIGDVVAQVQLLAPETALASLAGVQLATVAARESRETVLVDGTRRGRTLEAWLAHATLAASEPPAGVDAVHDHQWEGTRALSVGRDQAVDLLWPHRGARLSSVAEPLRRRLGGYDFVVIIADQVAPRTVPVVADVVLCVRLASTPLSWVRSTVVSLEARGRRVRAVVLWSGALPLVARRSFG